MVEAMQKDRRKRNSPMLKQLLESKPRLNTKMQLAMNSFNSIGRSRKYTGQSALPLPLTESDVIEHIKLYGCNSYEADILINIILALDNEWLKLETARRKSEANNG